jgi:hypothetical protein
LIEILPAQIVRISTPTETYELQVGECHVDTMTITPDPTGDTPVTFPVNVLAWVSAAEPNVMQVVPISGITALTVHPESTAPEVPT